MRIGIEVQRLFRKQKFGIETSALQLIKKLQQKNPSCDFVIYAKDDADKNCLHESDNLKVRTLTGKVFFDFEHVFLPLAAKNDRVDLLHCTGNTTPYFSSVPIVQTLHDVIFMDPIAKTDSLYQRFGNHYRRKVVPVVTPRSASVITVSEYEKKRIVSRLNIDERKIKVIYNGIDEDRFCIKDEPLLEGEVRKRYSLPDRFVLFLGNTAARKNALRAIEAYTIYASRVEKPLPIVTPGLPEKFISDHLASLNAQDKMKNFVCPGYIRDEDLSYLYNLSTIFLYPSLSEGFGMPLVEAMACGTPVITSNISCLPEIAGNAALLVDPTNTNAIAEAIERLLTDEVLRIDKVNEGLNNASRFSWDKTADQVLEVYEEVLYNQRKGMHTTSPVAYGI
ncbi:glycosyltransferase family 4 protein [Chryseosolibacter indicus]|uniref:Glycosyltransferase family 4 protein n=1 Tax=Chryseosolibacter indicus TaxID=2782351 RepID=A0ABS5VMA1_9BACT|nr:glycosyltransferase family 1 protein [Chryseosolibacter indicus]MBT1702580.1 glycosyltransferase family 4 protein [Chryseosolibacter indicus]